jgi:hypothetical protein
MLLFYPADLLNHRHTRTLLDQSMIHQMLNVHARHGLLMLKRTITLLRKKPLLRRQYQGVSYAAQIVIFVLL